MPDQADRSRGRSKHRAERPWDHSPESPIFWQSSLSPAQRFAGTFGRCLYMAGITAQRIVGCCAPCRGTAPHCHLLPSLRCDADTLQTCCLGDKEPFLTQLCRILAGPAALGTQLGPGCGSTTSPPRPLEPATHISSPVLCFPITPASIVSSPSSPGGQQSYN